MTGSPGPVRTERSVAIVTGASRGIGLAIASALAASGYAVELAARTRAALDDAVAAIAESGGEAAATAFDVTDQLGVDAFVADVVQRRQRIDLVVNNAGLIEPASPIWEADPQRWWQVVTVNVRGPFLVSRAAAPHMVRAGGGRIINLNSGAGGNDTADLTAYNASKAALSRITGGLHLAGAAHGIHAFDLAPGVVKTDMTQSMRMHEGRTSWTSPQEVSDLVLALASGDLDDWSGRLVRAGVDTPSSLAAQGLRGLGPDDRTLRLRPWGPDDPLA